MLERLGRLSTGRSLGRWADERPYLHLPVGRRRARLCRRGRRHAGLLGRQPLRADRRADEPRPRRGGDAYTHYGSDTALSVPAANGLLSNDGDAEGDGPTAVKVRDLSYGAA
jgi:hypothetical protein